MDQLGRQDLRDLRGLRGPLHPADLDALPAPQVPGREPQAPGRREPRKRSGASRAGELNNNKVNRRFTGRELKTSGASDDDETER